MTVVNTPPTDPAARSQKLQWLNLPLDIWSSTVSGWAGYFRTTADDARGIDPLSMVEDSAEFLRATTVRTPPTWATPHPAIREWPQARLLDASASDTDTEVVPTLVLPPQAGHASTIVDYSTDQSQLDTARDSGLTRLYCLEWLPGTAQTRRSSIDDYIRILDDAVDTLGGRVNLVGDCQGGWLAVIYTALRPDAVNTLAAGGAPIDFHAGTSAIQEWVQRLAPRQEMSFYRGLVAAGLGNHRGSNQIIGFKMLEPAQEYDRLMQLWGNIRDPRYVSRHIDFTNWFEWAQDVPGAFYLWIVEHLFIRNELISGDLVVDGQNVLLDRITCPVFMLAGTNDHITPPAQMFALADHVGTPADEIHRDLCEAGHLGLFMGHRALRDHWTGIFAAMAQRSATAPPLIE